MAETKTLGEARVRLHFNSTGTAIINDIKVESAKLIDLVEQLKAEKTNNGAMVADGEFIRLCSLAQTAYEEGAMWAVKAATF